MTDNFGPCGRCKTKGFTTRNDGVVIPCMECDGTGKSGNAMNDGYKPLLQKGPQMSKEVTTLDVNKTMEQVLIAGDLAKMDAKDRINYYLKTCESLGMNPMTKPFDLITLNGKMVLYPNRSGTDQLRKIGNVSLKIVDRKKDSDVYIVTAEARMPDGRTDESTGVVALGKGLFGDALANALMKAETKAKRRVTLSIMGLGWIDESEVSSVKGANLHKMDLDTGTVIDVTQPTKKEPNPALEAAVATVEKGIIANTEIDKKKNLMQRIKRVKEELGLTDEEVKAEAHRLFKKEDSKAMSLDELHQLLQVLEEEKVAREQKEMAATTTPEFEQALLDTPDFRA